MNVAVDGNQEESGVLHTTFRVEQTQSEWRCSCRIGEVICNYPAARNADCAAVSCAARVAGSCHQVEPVECTIVAGHNGTVVIAYPRRACCGSDTGGDEHIGMCTNRYHRATGTTTAQVNYRNTVITG